MNIQSVPSIGDRPLSLATHLRHLSDLLTSKAVIYEWNRYESCNCGLLARSITGLSPKGLRSLLDELSNGIVGAEAAGTATWKRLAKGYCPLNPSIPATTIFAQLRAAGLNQSDFDHLENLSHPELNLDWHDPKAHTNPLNVIAYCNRWAGIIEAFHAQSTNLDTIETRPLVEVNS